MDPKANTSSFNLIKRLKYILLVKEFKVVNTKNNLKKHYYNKL